MQSKRSSRGSGTHIGCTIKRMMNAHAKDAWNYRPRGCDGPELSHISPTRLPMTRAWHLNIKGRSEKSSIYNELTLIRLFSG